MHDRFAQKDQGKCYSCGFIAKTDSGRWLELNPDERDEGNLMTRPSDGTIFMPKCIVWAHDLETEYRSQLSMIAHSNQVENRAAGKKVLENDRHCASWYPYQSGFSPRDHVDHREQQRLETQREDFERRMADQANAAEANRDRFNRYWTVIFALFAIAAIYVQLVYPNGVDWNATWRWIGTLWPF